MEIPKRKPTRLKGYDYSQNGAYFITICTHNRKCILGNIAGQGFASTETILSQYGKITKDQLLDLENRYKSIKIDKYAIMPNHIHVIIIIGNTAGSSPCPQYQTLFVRLNR